MSDLLGEALARADNSPHYDIGWQLDPDSAETIVAAARNWHTRSEPDYLAAAKKLSWWLSEAEWEDIDDEIAGEWIVQARSIVDAALTVTAEPEKITYDEARRRGIVE